MPVNGAAMGGDDDELIAPTSLISPLSQPSPIEGEGVLCQPIMPCSLICSTSSGVHPSIDVRTSSLCSP